MRFLDLNLDLDFNLDLNLDLDLDLDLEKITYHVWANLDKRPRIRIIYEGIMIKSPDVRLDSAKSGYWPFLAKGVCIVFINETQKT